MPKKGEVVSVKTVLEQLEDEAEIIANEVGVLPIIDGSGLSSNQRVFLNAYYQEVMNIPKACHIANISMQTHKRWLRDNPMYAETFNDVRSMLCSVLESTMSKSAIVTKNSSVLLKMMERLQPTVYGAEASNEVRDEAKAIANLYQRLYNNPENKLEDK